MHTIWIPNVHNSTHESPAAKAWLKLYWTETERQSRDHPLVVNCTQDCRCNNPTCSQRCQDCLNTSSSQCIQVNLNQNIMILINGNKKCKCSLQYCSSSVAYFIFDIYFMYQRVEFSSYDISDMGCVLNTRVYTKMCQEAIMTMKHIALQYFNTSYFTLGKYIQLCYLSISVWYSTGRQMGYDAEVVVRAALWQPRASTGLVALRSGWAAGRRLCLKEVRNGASAMFCGREFHSTIVHG